MISSKLGVGPMSPQIIEAIFSFSEERNEELMIIASKNQIDYAGGYVNNWNTREFMDYVNILKGKYPQHKVLICRDHCGPGFNGIYDLEDTYKTIEEDIKCGFDLIHIDFCNHRGDRREKLIESKKAVEYCLELNPNIKLEIGTDENAGDNLESEDLVRIRDEIMFFKEFCNPEFYVVQTGSLTKETRQAGNFNREFVQKILIILREFNLKLKEHNADYLTKEQIRKRDLLVDAMNIAPQLGVVQTSWTLKKCLQYGIDYSDFFEEVVSKEKWKKWLDNNTKENKMQCFLIAGHYHFSSPHYKNILESIDRIENSSRGIIQAIKEVIKEYV
ncbi:MAG: class II D-tagatose-bisphosphate aldolase non-catalytic subunit [Nitrosarchaeum sp.]